MSGKYGVLLLHGLTGVPSEMRPVEKALQKLGYETEAPALAGHGGTNEELLNVRWPEWIESAQKALDSLAQRVDEKVVCGLSMGASISAILAAKNENVRGLIMLSPTLRYDSPSLDAKLYMRIYKNKLVRYVMSAIITALPIVGKKIFWSEAPPYGLKDERLQRQITKAIEAAKRGEDTKFGLFRTYFISLQQMLHITEAFKDAAGSVKCPTLIISSLEDTLVSINNAVETYAMLGTSNKSLVMLTGCDHVLTLDLKRNYVAGLVGEFMEAITGESSQRTANGEMDLSLEIHNRLNPLNNSDWAALVPGSPALNAFADELRQQGMHESQCHTMVIRMDNVPVLMLPLVVDESKKTAMLGISEDHWGMQTGRLPDKQTTADAWQQCQRVLKALLSAYGLTQKSYSTVPSESRRASLST